MFLVRLLQKILGYINFKIEGGNIEKFLNLTARAGVTLWNLRKAGDTLYASALEKNIKTLEEEAKKAGSSLTIIAIRGLPVKFERHKGRIGFIAGAVIFIVIIVYFSGFIWSVEITGNSAIPSSEIEYTLSDLGLSPGVRKSRLNTKSIEQKALMQLPELSWMHINLDGSVARVEVGERTQEPEIVADDRPCNIKASQTGQIVSIQVYEGVTNLKVNDTVRKGELLVSGVIEEPKTQITRYVHARAKVIARTSHQLTVTVPYRTAKMQDTGKVVKKYALDFMNVEIPFYHSEPEGNFRRMVYKSPLTIFGVRFPIAWKTTAFYEYVNTPVQLTKSEALKKAKELIAEKEKTELSGAAIKSRRYTENFGKNALTLRGDYVCEEDIGVMQEISFAEAESGIIS